MVDCWVASNANAIDGGREAGFLRAFNSKEEWVMRKHFIPRARAATLKTLFVVVAGTCVLAYPSIAAGTSRYWTDTTAVQWWDSDASWNSLPGGGGTSGQPTDWDDIYVTPKQFREALL